MTPCGQTKLQLPHWMQMSGSHTGTISEMLRFSQRGGAATARCRPSGSAQTGSSSPRPAIIIAVTFRTNSGASSGTSGGRGSAVAACSSGTSTSCRWASAASTASKFLRTTSSPFLP